MNVGTQYSQLDVTGTVTLNDSSLQVAEGFASKPGDQFQIIQNDGTDPVNGNFAGLSEGGVVVLAGVSYTITYQGGTGNDVVLTSNGNLPVIVLPTTATSNNEPEFRWIGVPSAATYTLQINNITTGQQNAVNVSGVTNSWYQTTSELPLGTYEARVQAFDSSGEPSLLSPIRQFTILPPFAPNTFLDSVDVNIGNGVALDASGKTSLRTAVQESNALPGTDKITLGAGTFTLTRTGSGEDAAATGDLDITDDVIIEGAGVDVTFINANSLDRVFHVRSGGKLTLKNLTITGGLVGTNQFGGGILNQGTLNLIDCKLIGNSAWTGGGLANVSPTASSATANVINTMFTGNTATQLGGAIMSRGYSTAFTSTMDLDNVTITSNTVPLTGIGGGGIYVVDWTNVSIRNSTLQSNSARSGGALYGTRVSTTDGISAVTIRNTDFLSNTATNNGGAIFGYSGTQLDIQDSLFSLNRTTDSNGTGGAMYVGQNSETVIITGTQFLDNQAPAWGGAIRAEAFGTFTIVGSEFRRNQANRAVGSTEGGAIHAQEGDQLLISESIFDANKVTSSGGRGGAIVLAGVSAEIKGSTFSGNIAQVEGGALLARSSSGTSSNDVTLQIDNSTFSGNRAVTGNGGAVQLVSGTSPVMTTMLTNVTITGNQAGGQGGGIHRNGFLDSAHLLQPSEHACGWQHSDDQQPGCVRSV